MSSLQLSVMHLRDRSLVVGESKTGEHSVLTRQVRGQTLRLEHVSLHHGEVGVGHRPQLAGVPHQGSDSVSPRQGLLHCLQPWVQTTKLELLFHFYKQQVTCLSSGSKYCELHCVNVVK